MGSKERKEIKELKRKLRRRNTIRQTTSAGNKFIATLLIGGVVVFIIMAIILAVWMF